MMGQSESLGLKSITRLHHSLVSLTSLAKGGGETDGENWKSADLQTYKKKLLSSADQLLETLLHSIIVVIDN